MAEATKPRTSGILVEAPAICYDEETDVLNRRLGEVLWDFFPLEEYVTKKTEWKYQRFALVYQQLADATSEESISGHFKFYDKLPHAMPEAARKALDSNQVDELGRPKIDRKEYFRRVVLSIDTAAKTTERSDYSVIQVWGETHDKNYYLFDQIREKVEFNQLIELIERAAIKYQVDAILVEDKGQGTAYIQARGKTDFQTRKAPAPVIPINPGTQSKEFRWDEVSPMIREGNVHLPKEAKWIDGYIKEIGQFPEGNHDDQVDATSQVLRWFKSQRSRYGSKKVKSMG
jgi:predicted phage terminase large subunit-like protein